MVVVRLPPSKMLRRVARKGFVSLFGLQDVCEMQETECDAGAARLRAEFEVNDALKALKAAVPGSVVAGWIEIAYRLYEYVRM